MWAQQGELPGVEKSFRNKINHKERISHSLSLSLLPFLSLCLCPCHFYFLPLISPYVSPSLPLSLPHSSLPSSLSLPHSSLPFSLPLPLPIYICISLSLLFLHLTWGNKLNIRPTELEGPWNGPWTIIPEFRPISGNGADDDIKLFLFTLKGSALSI